MTLTDEAFDVLLILMYLATPLVWAATLYFQGTTRSNHSHTGWNQSSTPSSSPPGKL